MLKGHLKGWLLIFWKILGRPDQKAPETPWNIWLILGGRGSGKTRSGAEWVRAQVRGGAKHIALVAPSFNEAREVMLEGESGLLNLGYPRERPRYIASRHRLEWPNGAVGHVYSAEDPDGLRGAQFDAAWADEFCAWTYPEDTLSNLRLGLRLGEDPRLVITTTPKRTPSLLKLVTMKGVHISQSKTADNAKYLSPGFAALMEENYGGSPLGKQELDGEILSELPGALWTLQGISDRRVEAAPELDRIVIAIDPPTTSGPRADACGIVVAGRADDLIYVLEDASFHRASPADWADRAVALYHHYRADAIIAEVNQGGEMVEACLAQVDPNVPVLTRHTNRNKRSRAEPVAQAYRRGKVRHAGRFDALEAEMCLMGTDSLRHSPDRADALVWAVGELMVEKVEQAVARMRWV
ncbi:DNA-packaging protein [Litorimonas sp. WD9-15]|uniref:DNA-packaging protein n=1 Tax=Litorimonas sp. WD9-15 TaxID=3418716 RepID=UPI003CFE18D1